MKYIVCLALAAVLLLAGSAQGQTTVANAWVRATVPHQKATGAFMQLQSANGSALIQVESPVTPDVEIHEMTMQDDIMRMRQVPAIRLPAGRTVELKPGSYHVMLLNLRQQIRVGHSVPLKLVFEGPDQRRETVEIRAPVRALNSEAIPAASGGLPK
ncbi:copper chaperone PCu(A)C [Telluria aromaticivorans]|uniref:Copper chaperone PCu(A)C n=1 Tax=Telluria aromaticivorans TaxID=2725995 RepID=A0A7Y2NXW7_9BURK|nr:copper chaperone PCu(A)C [Telluria aromaticivorans]NNG21448.1 copper chaperone PCu(A)C [Telluria aromaticivorans]